MHEHLATVEAVDAFHPPGVEPESWTRPGWVPSCPTCGPLGSTPGWAYARPADARRIATMHSRAHAHEQLELE